MSELVLNAPDRYGVLVRLTRRRWETHIIARHPEIEPFIEAIANVLASPEIVTQDDGGAFHHARAGTVDDDRFRRLYLDVVVRYRNLSEGMPGDILTVFFNARRPRGQLIWSETSER